MLKHNRTMAIFVGRTGTTLCAYFNIFLLCLLLPKAKTFKWHNILVVAVEEKVVLYYTCMVAIDMCQTFILSSFELIRTTAGYLQHFVFFLFRKKLLPENFFIAIFHDIQHLSVFFLQKNTVTNEFL